jgi:hypothetical protein
MTSTLSPLHEKYKRRLRNAIRATCNELAMRIETRTPVLSGNLQGKWQANKEPLMLEIGDTFVFINNAPYARYIEYLGNPARNPGVTKYAADAPYGMMHRTIAEFQQIVDEVAGHGG